MQPRGHSQVTTQERPVCRLCPRVLPVDCVPSVTAVSAVDLVAGVAGVDLVMGARAVVGVPPVASVAGP
eukprot:NODE_4611_length_784_cov_5.721088_g3831_i0.p6 GENE.NODE_4611_length_784_cov_5.721088_g3831_i0~~NODE_4611_length_784_cov_5.721088_g3831_i0.p6  ORF type:complete len:69 (+),score=3.91 NODE_4611_length_784_cov_5.721088_g3831_i0:339-545(+)